MSAHSEIREAVRRFAAEQLAPNAARWDRDSEFPREALKGLAAMGLYGIAIPEDLGGAGQQACSGTDGDDRGREDLVARPVRRWEPAGRNLPER